MIATYIELKMNRIYTVACDVRLMWSELTGHLVVFNLHVIKLWDVTLGRV